MDIFHMSDIIPQIGLPYPPYGRSNYNVPCPCLLYTSGFIPDAYSVPEEELICWSETSLKGPLTAESFQRYMELFKQVLPEESRRLAL